MDEREYERRVENLDRELEDYKERLEERAADWISEESHKRFERESERLPGRDMVVHLLSIMNDG